MGAMLGSGLYVPSRLVYRDVYTSSHFVWRHWDVWLSRLPILRVHCVHKRCGFAAAHRFKARNENMWNIGYVGSCYDDDVPPVCLYFSVLLWRRADVIVFGGDNFLGAQNERVQAVLLCDSRSCLIVHSP